MRNYKLDLSTHSPKSVVLYLDQPFDYVITVCGGAKESCPMFMGQVERRRHIGFEDPADATFTDEEIQEEFKKIRDQILVEFFAFYRKQQC